MIPRSAAEGQEVNSRNAEKVFPEHGGCRRGTENIAAVPHHRGTAAVGAGQGRGSVHWNRIESQAVQSVRFAAFPLMRMDRESMS